MANVPAQNTVIHGQSDTQSAQRVLAQARLGWLGQRATDALPLTHLANLEVLVTCEGGQDAVWIANACGATLVSLEHQAPTRDAWSNASIDLLADLAWPDATSRAEHSASAERLNLAAYCATPAWETRARQHGSAIRLLAPSVNLKRRLDDKRAFRAQMVALRLPVIPSEQAQRAQLSFDQLARRYGTPFVAQWPVSSAGKGTFFIHSADDLAAVVALEPAQDDWLISAYIGATTFNVNALCLPDGVWVAPPSVQLTGIPALADEAGLYCGNDFGEMSAYPPSVVAQLTIQTQHIGAWLAAQGFVGVFGVDFILSGADGHTVYPLELNPRFQGSTGLLGQWEWSRGRLPLLALHVLAWLGARLEPAEDDAATEVDPGALATGSQLIVHRRQADSVRVAAAVAPGVYALDDMGKLRLLRPGQSVTDCGAEEFVLAGIPMYGAQVAPGAVVARVLAQASLALPTGCKLTSWGAQVVEAVRRAILLGDGESVTPVKRANAAIV